MPKTHTSDVAAALPGSIDGPFVVVDPSDAANWIKLNPAGGAIAAAGAARPTRGLVAHYARSYFTASIQYLTGVILARAVNPDDLGGFFLAPLRIPDDADATSPITIRVALSPALNATTNGLVVRLLLSHTRVTSAGSSSSGDVTYDWPVPDDWTTSDIAIVALDNGNGHTYDAGTFTPGDLLGLRLVRQGNDAADTFDKGVKIAENVHLEYTATGY